MVEYFLIGLAVGVAGMFAKEKIVESSSAQRKTEKKQETDNLYSENEKFRRRNKEMERQIEDLLAENQKLRKKLSNVGDSNDDLEDDLQDAQRKVERLQQENLDLAKELREYKTACANYEIEIQNLKEK